MRLRKIGALLWDIVFIMVHVLLIGHLIMWHRRGLLTLSIKQLIFVQIMMLMTSVLFILYFLPALWVRWQRYRSGAVEQAARMNMSEVAYLQASKKQIMQRQALVLDYISELKRYLENETSYEESRELQQFMEQSDLGLYEKKQEKFCSHVFLNAILQSKAAIAEEKGITTHFQVFVGDKLDIEEIDFVTIMFNLLNNAIEACEAANVEKPYIDLQIRRKGSMIFLRMRNTKNTKVTFDGKTNKADWQNHGYGLRIIEEILKKYEGFSYYEDQGDAFLTEVGLIC